LVPPNTTLQFFSDSGQGLALPKTDKGGSDYAKVGPIFKQLTDQGPPLQAGASTYNFYLFPDDSEEERQAALDADWGGAQVIFVSSGNANLCTDRQGACPTPKLRAAALRHDKLKTLGSAAVTSFSEWLEANGEKAPEPALQQFVLDVFEDFTDDYFYYVAYGVSPERWHHSCDGILGTYAGNDLFWVACTTFTDAPPELPVLQTSTVHGPGSPRPTADQAEYDWKVVALKNEANIAGLDYDQSIVIAVAGNLLLIGGDQDIDGAEYVREHPEREEGLVTRRKTGLFKNQSLMEVHGIQKYANQLAARNEFMRLGFGDSKFLK
jgi:hypothetical protein